MPSSPRALLLIPHLNSGGAARVTRNLAVGLAGCGYNVHLAILLARQFDSEILPSVTVHCLGLPRVRWALPALLRLIRALQPDLILSNMAHLNQAVLALRPFLPGKTRILVRDDGGTDIQRLKPCSRAIWKQLHQCADAILCQSEQMASDLASALGSRKLLRILPNPVDLQKARMRAPGKSNWDGPGPHLLTSGRLVAVKGFDLLLSAFAAVVFHSATANLAILGEGPEFNALQRLTTKLGIAERVVFVGHAPNPEAWYPGTTLYIQPSREDALPNALLEAAAAGLPLIATPARGGMPALLQDQPGCWVAPELTALSLAHTITKALQCLTPEQRFAHAWFDPFAMPNAIERYDQVIRAVLTS